MEHKRRTKALSWLLSLAMALSLLPGLSGTARAVSGTEWNGNQTVSTDTSAEYVYLTADVTLTIETGVTLTVTGGIDATDHTLTVEGAGTLVVTGEDGSDGSDGGDGGAGGAGITGSLVVNGATVQVTGGSGGNGGSKMFGIGGNGGNGGNGVTGNVTVSSGSATVTGGSDGSGGTGRSRDGSAGSVGAAVTGTITGSAEESTDNSTWAAVSGTSSDKQYVKVEAAASPAHTHGGITFAAWSTADSLPTEAGNYYLTTDVTLSAHWDAPTGTTNLCLNGHKIDYTGNDSHVGDEPHEDGSMIRIPNGSTLNLYDDGTAEHRYTLDAERYSMLAAQVKDDATGANVQTFTGGYITGGKARAIINPKGGNFTMNGGTIIGGFNRGVSVSDGTFTMNGGNILGNYYNGVLVDYGSTFTMTGGTISYNIGGAGISGTGGVYVGSGGTFTMSGGEISHNTAGTELSPGFGGGVFVSDRGTFNLYGNPTIANNTNGANKASNICLKDTDSNVTTIHITDALTYTNPIGVMKVQSQYVQTQNGGHTTYVPIPGVFTSSTGSVKAKDYVDKFTSESEYPVEIEGDELRLGTVEPLAAVPYQAASWDSANNKVNYTTENCDSYTVVTSDTTAFEDGKWYVVKDDVTIKHRIDAANITTRITVNGTANLILMDGKTLTSGVTVRNGNTLNIYGQSAGTGKLCANSGTYSGIGGEPQYSGFDIIPGSGSCGTINIHGGTVEAQSNDSAAIGGYDSFAGGEVTIYGGTVTAWSNADGAGIGGGGDNTGAPGGTGGSGGTVTIYGGTVNATGGTGIGGGATNYGTGGAGGTVTIYGGTVNATGHRTYGGTGIGGGGKLRDGGKGGDGGTVAIYGGTVTATGSEGAMGIGGGKDNSNHGTLTLGAGVKLETSTDGTNWKDTADTSVRTRYMRTGASQGQSEGGTPSSDTPSSEPASDSVTSVTLDRTALSLTRGGTATLTATVAPVDAADKTVTWTSSNTGVATVDASGVVTAVAAGTATITVKTNDGGKTATCTVTVTSPASSSDDDGDDGSSTSASTTVSVPVSSDTKSVSVTAGVSGETATVQKPTTAQLEQIIGESVHTGEVTIDVSGLGKGITTASIPTETVKAVEQAVNDAANDATGMTVKLSEGSVTFDGQALTAITEQATGSNIQLNLDDIGERKLSNTQQAATKDMDVQAVYDAYLTSNGRRISDFKGGKATVTVPYELKAEQRAAGVTVWYVADNGEKTEMPSTYDGKDVMFTVEHFSNYVIAYDEERAAVCPQDSTCPISAFTDADPTAWYHDGVHYVLENGIMSGLGNGQFAPNDTTSRAMMAQILWNMEDKPAYSGALGFTDVSADDWFAAAVRWADAEGIIGGYGDGKFGPNDAVTREQLATILYRYAKYKGVDVSVGEDTNILSYDDAFDVSEWAIPAMQWAVGNGLISGRTASTLNPKDKATRAEIATIIMRYCENVAK